MFAPWLTDPRKTLGSPERMIAYPENQFAQSALSRVLQPAVKQQGTLTFLHGPAGTGKTHLVRSTLHRLLERSPRTPFLLATALDLAEMLEAADELGTWPDLITALTGHSVVVCEDLHELPRQGALQERLPPLWDQMLREGTSLVVTAQHPVSEIEGLSLRLANRLHGGLTAAIRPPGLEGRRKLVPHFAGLAGGTFNETAIHLAAERLTGSPGEIRSAIESVVRRLGRSATGVTPELLERLWLQPDELRILSFEQIVTAVAIEFGVPSSDLISRSRQQGLIVPRQIAMSLSRELTGQSLERVGAFYGRTHTTVAHGCERLRQQLRRSPSLRQQVLALKRRLLRTPHAECG